MKQQDYDTIVSCIQFGAPALAPELVRNLNKTIENSNNWVQHQKKLAAEKGDLTQQAQATEKKVE